MFLLNPYIYGKPYSNQYSMLFDGVDESLASASNPTFLPTTAWSGSVWMKINDIVTNLQMILCNDQVSGVNRSYLLYYRGSASGLRKLRIAFFNTDGTQNELDNVTPAYFEDGNWHHVAWTYTGDTTTNGFKFYVDGSKVNEMTSGSTGIRTFSGTSCKIAVGDSSVQTGSWGAGTTVNDVAMWERVLTPTEISEIYNAGSGGVNLAPYSPDVWYRMGNDIDDVWGGANWTVKDIGYGGHSADLTSKNMEEVDRVTDVP